jgi:hypothetical protein
MRRSAMVIMTAGLALLAVPQRVAAQAAGDSLSTSRATRAQHDSLAIHALRFPKGKVSAARKTKGAAPRIGAVAPVETPLPSRRAKAPK